MVDEKDEGYDSEEGEYHFSDDQVNYDVDGVTPPKKASPAPQPTTSASAVSVKEATLQKLTQHRRMVIGVVVFIVLISVVYKMMAPTSTEPPTDFTATTVAKAPKQPAAPVTPAAQTPTQLAAAAQPPIPVTPPPAPVEQPAAAPAAAMPPAPSATPSSPVMPVGAPGAPAQTMMPPSNPPSMESPQPMAQNTMPQPPSMQEQPTVAVQVNPQTGAPVTAAAMPADAMTKNIVDRLASLEQQNAALMNLLQTDYAQKMADYETQSTMTRGKLEEVTKRLNRMDAALNQISQALQGGGNGGGPRAEMMEDRMPAVPTTTAMKAMEPKVIYTVQAIIPGRAWLKSETGETVTVAEGDVLKNYGRVTKIDPYDGVVDIDTGNKMITLSYGTNLE